jgi:hypothetical protein
MMMAAATMIILRSCNRMKTNSIKQKKQHLKDVTFNFLVFIKPCDFLTAWNNYLLLKFLEWIGE